MVILLIQSFALTRAVVREVHAMLEMTHWRGERFYSGIRRVVESEVFVLLERLLRAELLS